MREMTIEEMKDYVLLEEMTNLSEEDKETMSFADAKKLLGWS
jgi:predicted DNA-binding protein